MKLLGGQIFNTCTQLLAAQVTESGIRIYYPGANITAGKNIINGGIPAGGSDFIVGLKEVFVPRCKG